MARYVVSRLAITVVMALLATLVIFLIANTVPGDPVLAQLGDIAASNKAVVAEWRAKYGLDLPLWQRYLIFLRGLLAGDLGHLDRLAAPGARTTSRQFAPATLELATAGFLLALVIGIPLGILAAVRRDSWIDHLARVVSLIGVSSPTFWLAFIMLAVFYGGLADRARPRAARPDRLRAEDRDRSLPGRHRVIAGDWEAFRDAAAHLVLPSIVLAAATLGLITRTTRASMLETMRPGLRPRRPRQGPARAHHRARPRAAERADPGRDARRPRLCEPAHRRGA